MQVKRDEALKVTPDEEESEWCKVLLGAGSEWSPKFPGYIAGAIEAADMARAVLDG